MWHILKDGLSAKKTRYEIIGATCTPDDSKLITADNFAEGHRMFA